MNLVLFYATKHADIKLWLTVST